jgi:hypothetical protein
MFFMVPTASHTHNSVAIVPEPVAAGAGLHTLALGLRGQIARRRCFIPRGARVRRARAE